MGEATRGFNNIQDVRKVGALVKPHVASLQEAVEAVSGIAKANKKGGASFGFKIGSPDPMPGNRAFPEASRASSSSPTLSDYGADPPHRRYARLSSR
jgi:hypothetical protein